MRFKIEKRKVINFAFKLFIVGIIVGAFIAYQKG